jgi:hypothetical protein
MIAILSDEFVALALQKLPRAFLLGAPILFAVITLAALLDTRLPGTLAREPAG